MINGGGVRMCQVFVSCIIVQVAGGTNQKTKVNPA